VSRTSGRLNCICGGSYGKFGLSECSSCQHYEDYKCGTDASYSIYDTEYTGI